jgi:hypothetical protein
VGARSWWYQLQDAIERSNLPASDRAIFRFYLSRANYESAELSARFTPAQKEAARGTGYTLRQVRRSERHLEHHGWLKITGATGPGKVRSVALAPGLDCDHAGRVHDQPTARGVRRTEDTRAPRTEDTNGGHAAGQSPHSTGS